VLASLAVCANPQEGEEGLASWYAGKFQGRQTASGEIFDTNKFTAAHKTLPFGTLVKVTNLDNGKTTVVRINDRGPFIPGRIIDLSRAAAVAIGMAGSGVARVRVEELPPDSPEASGIRAAEAEEQHTPVTYSIQVGAFRNEDYAQKLLAALEQKGIPGALALQRTSEGIYRVVVTKVKESELEATKQRLQENGWQDVLARREL